MIRIISAALLCLAVPAFSAEVLERPVFQFHSVPSQPKVGEKIVIFGALQSSFQNQEVIVEGFISGVPLRFEKSGEELFSASLNAYHEVKSQVEVRADIYLRDEKKSLRTRQAINLIKVAIRELDQQIAEETDLDRKAELEAERAKKAGQQSKLEADLEAMKAFLKSEIFSFSVEKDPANEAYPLVLSASPDTVTTGRRTKVKIAGERFAASPLVKIGGLGATVINASATEIEVLAPNFPVGSTGIKEIELKWAPVGEEPRKNAVLSNAFFVTDAGILKNLRPVAVTTGYVRAVWPVVNPVTLTGSNSYDENGDSLAYSWEVLAAPAGSAFPAGTLLDPVATPSFLPDKLGIFRIRMRVQETNTDQELLSYPSIVTVEVK